MQQAVSVVRPPALSEPIASAESGGLELIEQIANEWRELCDEGPCNLPIYRPEWFAAYLRHYEPGQRLLVITARSKGRLIAVLPLILERCRFCKLPANKLRGLAELLVLRFDLIRAVGAEGEAGVRVVWNFLKGLPGWDMLELPHVPAGGALETLYGMAKADGFPAARRESMRSPYIPLSGRGEVKDTVALARSAELRHKLRKTLRKIARNGSIGLRGVNQADPESLQCFYALENSGWKREARGAIVQHPAVLNFYNEIARAAERFGYLSLYFLELNGRIIAGQFGLMRARTALVLRSAYDENYSDISPGHLLLNALIGDCISQGVTEYDFTGPWFEWKGSWTAETRLHSHLQIFNKTAYGRLLYQTGCKIKPTLERMLRRKSGQGQPGGS